MKQIVAEHEIAHALTAMSTPLIRYISCVTLTELKEESRGEFKFDFGDDQLTDGDVVAHFAVSIAGPIHQLHHHPETVSEDIKNMIDSEGGLLKAYWWLHQNKPSSQFNWHADFQQWRSFNLHYNGFSYAPYYEVESALSTWFMQSAISECIADLSELLQRENTIEGEYLRGLNISMLPPLNLPTQLLPSGIMRL